MPRFIGWIESTSLSGLMWTRVEFSSMCSGRGSCRSMPWNLGFPLREHTSSNNSPWAVSWGRLKGLGVYAHLVAGLFFVPDVHGGRRVFANENGRESGDNPALAPDPSWPRLGQPRCESPPRLLFRPVSWPSTLVLPMLACFNERPGSCWTPSVGRIYNTLTWLETCTKGPVG